MLLAKVCCCNTGLFWTFRWHCMNVLTRGFSGMVICYEKFHITRMFILSSFLLYMAVSFTKVSLQILLFVFDGLLYFPMCSIESVNLDLYLSHIYKPVYNSRQSIHLDIGFKTQPVQVWYSTLLKRNRFNRKCCQFC